MDIDLFRFKELDPPTGMTTIEFFESLVPLGLVLAYGADGTPEAGNLQSFVGIYPNQLICLEKPEDLELETRMIDS